MKNTNEVFVDEVIICRTKRRGNGKTIPIRIVIEVFEKNGNFIAESDPYQYTIEEIIAITKCDPTLFFDS